MDILMDFVEGLPRSNGFNVILLVINRFSKYGHFFLLSHPYIEKEVAKDFFAGVFKLNGIRRTIVSNRDKVYLRLQPYHQVSVAVMHHLKLSPHFFGSFHVIERIGSVAYRLDLSESARINSVFHVSCLKKKLSTHVHRLPTLPPMSSHGEILSKPNSILEKRLSKEGNQAITKVMVKWLGVIELENTWEKLNRLKELYQHLLARSFDSGESCYRAEIQKCESLKRNVEALEER